MRGATRLPGLSTPVRANFNPHSPCGERRFSHLPITKYVLISIHTPHAGSDWNGPADNNGVAISIHTPHAGSDVPKEPFYYHKYHFNPHSPCGERRRWSWTGVRRSYFNPHSPCGERLNLELFAVLVIVFQSTLPMRGATAAPS